MNIEILSKLNDKETHEGLTTKDFMDVRIDLNMNKVEFGKIIQQMIDDGLLNSSKIETVEMGIPPNNDIILIPKDGNPSKNIITPLGKSILDI